MGGQKTEGTNYTTHIIVFLLLTVFMYVFAYVLAESMLAKQCCPPLPLSHDKH
jgi:hypothetical protein